MGTFYLDVIENKVLNFPIKFHGLQVKNTDKAVGISDLKGYISTGLAAEGKGRQNPTKRWETKSSIRGGDYDDHYNIKHTGQLQQQPMNPGH